MAVKVGPLMQELHGSDDASTVARIATLDAEVADVKQQYYGQCQCFDCQVDREMLAAVARATQAAIEQKVEEDLKMRTFDTGATRDSDENKPDYEGFLSPQVLRLYGQYMLKHQKQADGQMRPSDNWQKGIPREAYMKSMFRHFMEAWAWHRSQNHFDPTSSYADAVVNPSMGEQHKEALCALLFNVMGYLYELENGR